MNEAETRAELIDPKLRASGWGEIEGSKVMREFHINLGRVQSGGVRLKPEIADYILVYKSQKLAVIEAKSDELDATEGVTQAKTYASKLKIDNTYSTNGKEIYEISMETGLEQYVDRFPTPDELWQRVYSDRNEWRYKLSQIPFEDVNGSKGARYYQEIAVNKTIEAIATQKERILLTLATGTGKTFIAFQVAWKLFHARWNLQRDGGRRPRILFLADRNILANQAFNAFSAFPEDALVRINPADIRKKGAVPTNGSIFFTIFQTFMSGQNTTPYFGEYPKDFFDFIIIDECHRGGAKDESNWRDILNYFSPAVQLGLTATPKRRDNVDTYRYFGEPIYTYSLKEGVNDGFLTPFKVKRVQTTLDDYVYTSDDEVVEGQVEQGRVYEEKDFNRVIQIMEREANRVKIFMQEIDQNEKTIVFCASQPHALAVRNIVNQIKASRDPNYCVRVTADDGERGEQYLREFQDNEKTIPTILTTSQKLSTGVDARNVRNIVLMRPINSMIEFKQIVGRGTRLFDGKDYFTIYDFVNAYKLFSDPEWDGEPIDTQTENPSGVGNGSMPTPIVGGGETFVNTMTKIKLADGKDREIQHMIAVSFWSADGKPISSDEFIHNLYGKLLSLLTSLEDLQTIWSDSNARKDLLEKLDDAGFGKDELVGLQKLIKSDNSDLLDALAYVAFKSEPKSRVQRSETARQRMHENFEPLQKEFADFVLEKYIESGAGVLNESQLGVLLSLKYGAIDDAERILGGVNQIRKTFSDLQKYLYDN